MDKEYASYLSRLRFDKKLLESFQGKYLKNTRLMILLVTLISVIGIFSYLNIPRRLNPEVEIPIVTVSTILPGAPPSDIELLVTNPLEDKLKSVKNLDSITSTSTDNASFIVLQFLSTVDSKDARDEVQKAVDQVTDLPEDAEAPSVVALDFENQPIWTFALASDDYPSLMRKADNLRKIIEELSSVDKVELSGFDKRIITVTIDPASLATYNVSPTAISSIIQKNSSTFSPGQLSGGKTSFALGIDPSVTNIESLRNMNISVSGKILQLKDIAQIQENSDPKNTQTLFADKDNASKFAVQFFVYKTKSANIDKAGKEIRKTVESDLALSENIKLVDIRDSAQDISKQFNDLVKEFGVTVLLIAIVLLIFLGLKQALIASLTVPLTFLSAISIASALGQSLNFLTVFAFLIALGLLIDDTIVIVTAMTRYYASKKFTPYETGILVWRDFIVPIWSTTITTIWSFAPLLLATGIIGEFIKPIPIIVSATMLSSTAIAVLITIPLMIFFLKPSLPQRVISFIKFLFLATYLALGFYLIPDSKIKILVFIVFVIFSYLIYFHRISLLKKIKRIFKNKKIQNKFSNIALITSHGVVNTESLSVRYSHVLSKILASKSLRIKTLIFIIIFSLISYFLVPLGIVKNEFFPKTDEETMYVSIELPAGTSKNETQLEMAKVLPNIVNISGVKKVIAENGVLVNSSGDRTNASNAITFTVDVGEKNERQKSSIEIAEEIRDAFISYQKGKVVVSEVSGGPPAGADVSISVLGEDMNELDSIAQALMEYLSLQNGVINIDSSYKPGSSKLVFVPDESHLVSEGIDKQSLGLYLRVLASGFSLDKLTINDTEYDVVLRFDKENAIPNDLNKLLVKNSKGADVPLSSLGKFVLKENPTVLNHDDTKRVVTVTASVEKGFSAPEINSKLLEYSKKIELPPLYSFKTGGANEENQKSVQSIIQAMGLSFLLILITMVLEFKSFRQAFIVMLSIPLAISGVFYIFGLTQTPLSFPALIGVLALFGIVVTNAIVVVDKINSNIAEGMSLKEAIVDASGSRLEPVLLTSLTTIFGLLPITLTDPLWRGLGGAIIAGLFFSGVIKLFFVPVVYYMLFKGEEK
jgi:HAE1 family hydrophobic/amphiphilic exporter-1